MNVPGGEIEKIAAARCDPHLVNRAEGMATMLLRYGEHNMESAWKVVDDLRAALASQFPKAGIPIYKREPDDVTANVLAAVP